MAVEQFGRRLVIDVHGSRLVDWRAFGDEDAAPTLDGEFSVLQHAKPEPLTCEAKLFNLSEERRAQLTAQQTRAREIGWKQYQAVQSGAVLVAPGEEAQTAASLVASVGLIEIRAGYQTDDTLLSRTQILAEGGIKHEYNGTDWVTTIRSQDSRLPWQNAFVSQPVAPGVNLRDVNRVLEASQQFLEGELAEKAFAEQFPEMVIKKPVPGYRNGFVLHGAAREPAGDIADSLGIEYFYLNGALVYTPKGATTLPQAIRLSKANNLLWAAESDRGFYDATSLLDAKLTPGRQVLLVDRDDVTPVGVGIYRIDSVTHAGSNFGGGQFLSTLSLRPSALAAATNL